MGLDSARKGAQPCSLQWALPPSCAGAWCGSLACRPLTSQLCHLATVWSWASHSLGSLYLPICKMGRGVPSPQGFRVLVVVNPLTAGIVLSPGLIPV